MAAARVDLFRHPAAAADLRDETGSGGAALRVHDIRLDLRAAEVAGWYRLKLVWPGVKIRRVVVAADGLAPYDTLVRQERLAAYVFLRRGLTRFALQVHADAESAGAPSATLRRIHPVEYAWQAGRHGLTRPRTYARYFTDQVDAFMFSETFPAPALLAGENAPYQAWIAAREPEIAPALLSALRVEVRERPRVGVLMPVCDPEPIYLQAAINSVRNQSSPHWQLCIADDASTRSDVRALLAAAAREDKRIRLVMRDRRGHISAATNDAFALCDTPLATSLDHDDRLAPQAIEIAAAYYSARPDTALLYSDEDKIDQHGDRYQPYFKPDFSPELLHSHNYINHLTVHRSESIRRAGGWRSAFDGAQDYDLVLRTLEFSDPAKVRHVPAVLYHWRAIAGSAALSLNYKPYAIGAGQAALAEHLERRGVPVDVSVTPQSFYRVRYELPAPPPKVAIIIPTRDKAALLRRCVESVRLSTYPNVEIIIVDNGSAEPDALALLDTFRATAGMRVLPSPGAFNYSTINNMAVAAADAEFVCLLNNDVEVITPDWLSDMMGYALQPGVGCVGAKLLYENETVQHAGVVIGLGGVAGHAFLEMPREAPGYFSRAIVASNWSAVTGACLLLRRQLYLDVGGLDETQLAIAFNDIDLCLKVRNAGYRNVLTPYAQLYHYESLSRGAEDTPEKQARFGRELEVMLARYGDTLLRDPYYSPHLDLVTDFRLGPARGLTLTE